MRNIAARLRAILPSLALLLGAACARLPAEAARGTPAAAAVTGFAAISSLGLPLGAAVAVRPDRLLTNAHILPDGVTRVQARRGDGGSLVPAVVLARSTRMDLAVLGVAPGHFVPPPVREAPALAGLALWALGAPNAGAALAQGAVLQPDVHAAGRGQGLTARLDALMGYSGGPVLDAEGRLVGLTTALLHPGPAMLLASLTGLDLHGLVMSRGDREVFVLSAATALAEFERIAPER